MPSLSTQSTQIIVNNVLIVPLVGLIEQEPFSGGWLIIKFNALELDSDGNE